MSTNTDLKVLHKFSSVIDAEQAKGYLDAQEISAFVADSHTHDMLSYMAPAFNGVRLMVMAEDFEKASEILKEYLHTPHVRIVEEGKILENPHESYAKKAFWSAVFSYVFIPVVLNAVSIVRIVQFYRLPGVASAKAQRDIRLAIVFNVVMVAGLLALFLYGTV